MGKISVMGKSKYLQFSLLPKRVENLFLIFPNSPRRILIRCSAEEVINLSYLYPAILQPLAASRQHTKYIVYRTE